uniref:Uncharacterized protein n=1 Tax=Oryza sativa subsp. japonica TaxID=39947 RepID=Q10QX6_ORYSJ|nr:hypothetical protein LOC_Os03g08210 [Oryza sativa Japonica Group]
MGYSFNSKGLKTDELLPYGLGFSGGRLAFAAGEQSGEWLQLKKKPASWGS